jgi:NNP family nitrate/nitrite transporter-like MFS transporter
VLGLFVGMAGGSFAVGIAYTSAWFSKERQGTAMGIFGRRQCRFVAHQIHRSDADRGFGDRFVAERSQVYSIALLVMAVLFWFFTYEDPLHRKGAQKDQRRPTLGEQLMPLLDLRVWRFGLAYYFVFGAFVALALWLPK